MFKLSPQGYDGKTKWRIFSQYILLDKMKPYMEAFSARYQVCFNHYPLNMDPKNYIKKKTRQENLLNCTYIFVFDLLRLFGSRLWQFANVAMSDVEYWPTCFNCNIPWNYCAFIFHLNLYFFWFKTTLYIY